MSVLPAKIDKHLSGICYWPDGTAVIATSCLAGRYWTGSIWSYKNPCDVPDIRKCITGVETDSGVCDIVPLCQNKVLIGLDSGAVEILGQEDDPIVLKSEFYGNEHDDLVVSVDVSHDLTKAVSGSYDCCIKVWCLESYASIHTYRPAHADLIRCVAFSKKESDIFLSCGLDKRLILWDTRLPTPARLLGGVANERVPTAVTWSPQSTVVAVGWETGEISLVDVRKGNSATDKWPAHSRSVHRLCFSPSNSNLLASCADETRVVVSDVSRESPEIIFKTESHEDFVRGLWWHPQSSNQLYSCGWDTRVFAHSVEES